MRSYTLSFCALAGLLLAGWHPARAQERDPRERDHNHDWGRAHRVIERTQEDLRHVEHHDAWAVADRGHYEAAERNLTDVRRDLDQNLLDPNRLDQAIAEIEHISHVDMLDRHARERLSEDVRELHRMRDDWHWR